MGILFDILELEKGLVGPLVTENLVLLALKNSDAVCNYIEYKYC